MRIIFAALFIAIFLGVTSQSQTFTKDGLEYVLELPTPSWRAISRVDVHDHLEFVNGDDEFSGYLRLTKMLVDPGTTAAYLFQSDEKWNLQNLPGYMVCSDYKGEAFSGHLNGASFSYEYISSGRPMVGRIYYLQLDQRTFYALRFTVVQKKLQTLRPQMDFIAGSFRLK
jgi:hypothetical protein